jgi:alkanesulfonate monooxygenase SsuD/methylene tetrahydromethanopterin reductase-like flavin-dependent oxidoreductase (luciferase family)
VDIAFPPLRVRHRDISRLSEYKIYREFGLSTPGLGYKLFAELYPPRELVRQAVRAEEAGFDFVEISDHYHPWLFSHEHSGFAWSVLGAIAARTVRAGERLNEHVVGRGWPAVGVRHEMLREALGIIRLLWSGGYHSYRGTHLTLEDARVFDLPDSPPRIAVAIGGPAAAQLAADVGDAIFATEPEDELVEAYREAGGDGPGTARCRWPGPPTRPTPSSRRTA